MKTSCSYQLRKGLTLIEVCCVLCIVSIVFGSAIPSFGEYLERRVLEGHSASLTQDVQYARAEAVQRGEGVRMSVRAASDGGRCVLVHTGSADRCHCAGGQARCDSPAVLLKSTHFALGGAVDVAATAGSIRFDAVNGTVSPTGTFVLSRRDGQSVRHVVNILGRVRTCSTDRAVTGQPPC